MTDIDPFSPQVIGGIGAPPEEGVVLAAYALLLDPAAPVFVQELPTGRWGVVPPGGGAQLLAAVRELGEGKGTYWTVNPLPAGHSGTVKVADPTRRMNLLIDVDPIKEKGHEGDNATDEEHEAARQVAHAILEELVARGWPAPAVIDSGNGWYLVSRIDLPNTPHSRALLKKLLAVLGQRHGAGAMVDPHVINANRIMKVPGTWARKGPHSEVGPHRLCRIVHAPDPFEVVTAEQIAALAEIGTPSAAPPPTNGTHPAPEVDPFAPQASNGGVDGGRAYARKALAGWVALLAAAPVGSRNQTFNNAVFRMARLVAGGCILRQEAEDALKTQARMVGLEEGEVAATWESAFNAGYSEPEAPPPLPGDRKKARGPQSAADAVPRGESVIVRASSIEPRKVTWLWPLRIPEGKLTTFAGQGGLGKTFVMLDIAARVTRGLDWPDSQGVCCERGQVLFLSGEDDPDDTLVPRLIELGADLNMVAFLRFEVQDRFTLADLKTLDRALSEMGPGVRLVGIDPPSCFLGDVDDHKNAEVRSLLSPLKSWAAKNRLAVVFNTHFTKSGGAKVEAMQRVMASVAWVNAVRAAHAFAPDPDDPTRVFFLPMKMNLARKKKGLVYRIVESPNDMARVEWLGEVDVSADDAVNRERNKPRKAVAAEWLIDRFREKREWPSDELFQAAKAVGVSRDAMFEAKAKLKLPKARKRTQENGDVVWLWWVPEDWPQLSPPDTCDTCDTCTQEEF